MMRAWPLAILALLILPLGAAQQPGEFEFSEDYLARVAYGDIPTSRTGEPAGAWNIAEYVRVAHDGNETTIPIASSQGTIVALDCTCNQTSQQENEIVIPAGEAPGTYVVALIRTIGEGEAAAFDLALFTGQSDARIVSYTPTGSSVQTNAADLGTGLPCTDAPCTIQEYAPGTGTWFLIAPDTGDDGTVVPAPEDDDGLAEWLPAIIAFLAGIALWAFLVQRGLVQKRRRQEVAKAAHVEAATEGKETLAARKQVLMAGLKQLEVAKMNKDIESEVYDKLKAELKKETVTVMRALEAAE